jgi:hypothetical protein
MARTPEELDAALERAWQRSQPRPAPSRDSGAAGTALALALGAAVLWKMGVVPGVGGRGRVPGPLELAGLASGVLGLTALIVVGQRWLAARRAAMSPAMPLRRGRARRAIESPSHGVVFIVDDGVLGEQLPFLAFESLAPVSLDGAAYLEAEHGLLVRQRISAEAARERERDGEAVAEGTVDHRVKLPPEVSPETAHALAKWLLQRCRVSEPGELGPPP